MIIAVTGTPGTGKTAVSRQLAEMLGFEYVDVNSFSERSDVETGEDTDRGATEVDVDSLVDVLERDVGEDAVLDGHLSHFFPADLAVVLRCEPSELESRLEEKGWSEEKIRENVEAEVLDLVLQQAVEKGGKVMEVDTAGREPGEVAETVSEAVEAGEIQDELRPGSVSWDPEKYL